MSKIPWWRLPTLLAVPRLIQIRNELRQKNLVDTEDKPLNEGIDPIEKNPQLRYTRTCDGSYNDLKYPRMGSSRARFGRNMPLEHCFPDQEKLMIPNPRTVSRELFTRDQFQPVPFLNLLAAAWIQFQVHDWFAHGRDTASPKWFEVALEPGDDWPEKPMRIPPTPADPTYDPTSGKPPTFLNQNSHWWDASQIYGCSPDETLRLRTGADGKIKLQEDRLLFLDPENGLDLTGFVDNWWMGLSLLHALFTAEHNAICDALKKEYPTWSEEHLFVKARLINAALMAKIHTVEWTPAILPNPTTQLAMRVNWRGLSEELQKVFPFMNDSEVLGGIVGSKHDHHAAPYSLTEEFVSVYRMHALIPDEFQIQKMGTPGKSKTYTLHEVFGRANRSVFDEFSMLDVLYSFGQMHPGMIRLHNFPKSLQNLVRDDGERIDLATVDILRDRERGVPRYNKFRELLRMPRINSFEELTDNPEWAEQIRKVYKGNIDDVDLQVGLQAEPLPDGFGFSETAFRIFILMASRRLKSDRFFTDDYTPEIYTQFGLNWIEKNTMKSVLLRHFPELEQTLGGVSNAFNPWKKV